MDITRLKPVRISPFAKGKVILDFFPDLAEDEMLEKNQTLDNRSTTMHAGALCLYATTLITKIHENKPLDLEPYYEERANSLFTIIKNNPKYTNYTDEQIKATIDNMIARDIRNCFAHGNFDISYDIYTKKLYYVLHPQRKDFVTDEPIVISKNSLINANKKFLQQKGESYSSFSISMLQQEIANNLSNTLKGFLLPTQMLKLANYYISNKNISKNEVLFDTKIYYLIQYTLLATKITYEQDDYYNIFGKDSNVFTTISLVRNSIAHDSFDFIDNAYKINYTDKTKHLSEPIAESTVKLFVVDSQKQIIKNLQNKHNPESLANLSERFKEIFDFFFDKQKNIEDIINVNINKETEPNEMQ